MLRRQPRGDLLGWWFVALVLASSAFVGMAVAEEAAVPRLPTPDVSGADTPGPALKYETDQRVYKKGDVVHITVTNVSDVPTPIVDRAAVAGEFAVLETKSGEGDWRPVDLDAGDTLVSFRSLPPGERHEYLWPTSGYQGSDRLAVPGTYRIGFGRPFYTNPFEIADK